MSTNTVDASKIWVTTEDEVVISGIAGRFPESNNVHELRDNLMQMRDMVTSDDRRWKIENPRIPKDSGKINNLEKFDSVFFGVHAKQAHALDPMCRILLEHTYEAIIDAGINPKQLRGTKTGVFIGAALSDSARKWAHREQDDGFGLLGHAGSFYSNRISYWLDITGPSYTLDTGCGSSCYAIDQAYRAIKYGLCDAAIVGSGCLCLDPFMTKQMFCLGALSSKGRCKTWDQSADGYVRSEAVCVVFLQKAKDAKRIYTTFVHSKSNSDGYKEEGISFPSSNMQDSLISEVYAECRVSPLNVNYVEAHGTGTKVGDLQEITVIDKVFGKNRPKNEPLLIGSVKTNLGHTEIPSGLVSLTKIILAMETGIIPPNLHFKNCKESLTPILEGRLKVVTNLTPWKGDYAALSNFGFGGVNAHVVLRINSKEKLNNGAPDDDLPRLVVCSGRTEEAVASMLTDLASKPVDVEQLALLYNIHSDEINGHLYRGYAILPPRGISEFPEMQINPAIENKRPVWFVFSGMGSQWPGMGEALLRIPIFAEAIKKCDAVLKPLGIDITHLITDGKQSTFDNALNCFIGIIAVQIGLVDVLHSLGIKPDYIIGHSVGELGCAYADGCLNAEQTITAAYYRGLAFKENNFSGSMAAVALGYKDIQKLCPPGIEVACHNSPNSSTISGPAGSIKKFVAELEAQNIFTREVPCSNIPYHSSYIAAVGPKFLRSMKTVIQETKPRSSKWLSTSVQMDKWNTELARYCSAEYFTNNLLNPVLFEETLALISKDAITIELAPHGLLQAILNRSLPNSVTNISLTKRGHTDNIEVFLRGIGKIFNVGLQPQISKLYPTVTFPVSRGTPMISPMIKWEHTDDWSVAYFNTGNKLGPGERVISFNIKSPDYESVAGSVINGSIIIPASCYLIMIWETLAMMKNEPYSKLPIIVEDVKFLSSRTIPKGGEMELTLIIQKDNGRFEITEDDKAIVTGTISSPLNSEIRSVRECFNLNENKGEEYMTSRDVYKELTLRGYEYTGPYHSISKSTATGSNAHIIWLNDWRAYIDNMIQMTLLGHDTRELLLPTSIKKLIIDPQFHYEHLNNSVTKNELEAFYDQFHNVVISGGIAILGLQAQPVFRKELIHEPVNEEHKFVSFMDEAHMSIREIARFVTNIVVENTTGTQVKTVEMVDEEDEESFSTEKLLSPWIFESIRDMSLAQADIGILSKKTTFESHSIPAGVSLIDTQKVNNGASAVLVMGQQLLAEERITHLNRALHQIQPKGFILSREKGTLNIEKIAHDKGFHIISLKRSGKESFVLLRKEEDTPVNFLTIEVTNNNFDWVESMRKMMSQELEKKNNTRILLVGQDGFENGLLGLINCLRREPGGEMVRGILIQDTTAPAFSLENPLYSRQLEKDLVVSVFRKNELWGSYNHFPLNFDESKLVYHSFLKQTIRGDVTSLKWIEGSLQPNYRDENLVKIIYASLNSRDIMSATGKLPLSSGAVGTRQDRGTAFSLEYSGIDSSRKRMMGLIEDGALSNMYISDPGLKWDIPDSWSLEDAATVPYAYATCCYALYLKGNMKKGDKVLIHAGAEEIGQAAINLAIAEGCEVFTTVGTEKKRQFIKKAFPQIGDDHIGNSHDTSFEYTIKKQTNGHGVDIVLNSSTEQELLASINCLAWGGRFLEIGNSDFVTNNPLDMEHLLREISFQGIILNRIFSASNEKKLEIKLLLDKYVNSGAVKPLARTVFSRNNIETAFGHIAAGNYIGKVLINLQNENLLSPMQLSVPQYNCLKNRSYIVLGGFGDFSIELCDWLITRGAKNLVIASRTGMKNGYQIRKEELWKRYGVNVIAVSDKDTAVYKDCQEIIDIAAQLAPIDGIFNLAVTSHDASPDKQIPESFQQSFRVKACTTKNLDIISRKSCPELRHFVVFSSVTGARGNPKQWDCDMSNSVMERICEKRAADGFPALAVQWGAVDDVGIIADEQEVKKGISNKIPSQSISSCLKQLNNFLLQNRPIVASQIIADTKVTLNESSKPNMLNAIRDIMFYTDLKGINMHTPLPQLGMDSMMAVEIQNTLEREFNVILSTEDIRKLSFAKIQELTVE